MSKQPYIHGVFQDFEIAERAIQDLLSANFAKEEIGVLIPKSDVPERQAEADRNSPSPVGHTVAGATTGGILGGLLGGITALAIPGAGPVLGTGMLMMAGGGAIAGGFSGLMATLGVTHRGVEWYEAELQSGRIIVVVQSNERSEEASEILRKHGAQEVGTIAEIEQIEI